MDTPSEARLILARWLGKDADSCGLSPVHAGFSDALVFHVSAPGGEFALRRWPAVTDPRRVAGLHQWLLDLAQAGLPVPRPVPFGAARETVAAVNGRLWHLEPWLPGSPVEGNNLSQTQVQSAMQLLSRMHESAGSHHCAAPASEWFRVHRGTSPGILNRMAVLDRWSSTKVQNVYAEIRQGLEMDLRNMALRILEQYSRHSGMIRGELAAVANTPVPLHPCFRDLWSAHVLFIGENVSGIIDPAAASSDHIASDLSRLLGSWLGDDQDRWEAAIDCYSQHRPLSAHDRQLIRVYDRSAVLLSGLNWIERMRAGTIQETRRPAVLQRMERIYQRMLRLSPPQDG